MKRYIRLMTVSLVLLLVLSCERDTVSGIDGSVRVRLDNMINGYVEQLKSSEYGWLASINTKEGYYQFWMAFGPGDKVVMYTDNTNYSMYKQVPDTSTFAFKALQRPTLIFDTYSYLSYINDPNPAISGDKNNGYTGLKTDFEFEVDSVKNDMFYMTGLVNRAKAIFRMASKEDFEGVKAGLMVDLPPQVVTTLNTNNIFASYNGTEIVVKIYNDRLMYIFWYNDGKQTGEENTGYYNVEVNGSGDLFFPEPVVTQTVSLTGLKYEKSKNQYVGFYTGKGEVIPATITYNAPDFALSKVFGFLGSDKIFQTLEYPNNLASPIGGITNSSLSLTTKLLALAILATGYDLHYNLQTTDGSPELAVYFVPTAIGLDISGNGTLTTTFPTSEYRIPITLLSSDGLTFKTANKAIMDYGAQVYYDRNVMTELIDNFTGKTFKLDWSTACRSSAGLAVQFTSTETNFAPPALLAK